MPEKIDRSIVLPVYLALEEWEVLVGPVVFDRDAQGKRIKPPAHGYVAYELLVRGARVKIKDQLRESFPGKD